MGAVVSNIRARFRDGLHLLREDYLQIDDELELSITKTYLRMFFACMVFNIVGLITYEWGNEFMGYILMFSVPMSILFWFIGYLDWADFLVAATAELPSQPLQSTPATWLAPETSLDV
ncbi:unnamed protein product [Larinioides sclopetarius]|uniref:Uncharacterized protein n=1 Tax=Larinioides sclopetarius TaxID=280406 RepID=A0AAV2B289_9ARAC